MLAEVNLKCFKLKLWLMVFNPHASLRTGFGELHSCLVSKGPSINLTKTNNECDQAVNQ